MLKRQQRIRLDWNENYSKRTCSMSAHTQMKMFLPRRKRRWAPAPIGFSRMFNFKSTFLVQILQPLGRRPTCTRSRDSPSCFLNYLRSKMAHSEPACIGQTFIKPAFNSLTCFFSKFMLCNQPWARLFSAVVIKAKKYMLSKVKLSEMTFYF